MFAGAAFWSEIQQSPDSERERANEEPQGQEASSPEKNATNDPNYPKPSGHRSADHQDPKHDERDIEVAPENMDRLPELAEAMQNTFDAWIELTDLGETPDPPPSGRIFRD